jgi:hypothetical protein
MFRSSRNCGSGCRRHPRPCGDVVEAQWPRASVLEALPGTLNVAPAYDGGECERTHFDEGLASPSHVRPIRLRSAYFKAQPSGVQYLATPRRCHVSEASARKTCFRGIGHPALRCLVPFVAVPGMASAVGRDRRSSARWATGPVWVAGVSGEVRANQPAMRVVVGGSHTTIGDACGGACNFSAGTLNCRGLPSQVKAKTTFVQASAVAGTKGE